jgi:replicative DNA helicase
MSKGNNTGNNAIISFFEDNDSDNVFDSNYQNRFLNVFMSDKEGFAEQIIDIVFVDYFDAHQKLLMKYQVDYFKKYRKVAKFHTLRDIVNDNETGIEQQRLLALIDEIEKLDVDDAKAVKDRSYEYFKRRSLKTCLWGLIEDWKSEKYDSMKTRLEDSLKAGEPKDTGHDYVKDVDKRLTKDYRDPIPCMPGLDERIGGGLSAGELGIVLAPPGGGKSMMLVKFASEALRAGKKVVYYTLELSEKVVGQRFDACLNDIHLRSVWNFPDYIKQTANEIAAKGGNLKIKEFPTMMATTNSILSHLRSLEMNENFVPDEIFIDYADIMKPLSNFSEKRHALTSVYEGIRGIAVEHGVPVWTASQTNRSGMDKEKFGLDVIGEALGKAATADLIIGVGRTEEQKVAKPPRATFGVLKNRNGADGYYLYGTFDTSRIFIRLDDEFITPPNKAEKAFLSGALKEREPEDGSINNLISTAAQ